MFEVLGHFHDVDGELDVHVALDLAAAGGVGKFLGRLGDHGVAIVVEPVDQGPDRGIFLVLDQRGVVEGAHQDALLGEEFEEALVVDVKAECAGGGVEIRAVDEQPDTFL